MNSGAARGGVKVPEMSGALSAAQAIGLASSKLIKNIQAKCDICRFMRSQRDGRGFGGFSEALVDIALIGDGMLDRAGVNGELH